MKAGEEQNGSRKGWDVERGGMEGKGQEVGMYICYNRIISTSTHECSGMLLTADGFFLQNFHFSCSDVMFILSIQ